MKARGQLFESDAERPSFEEPVFGHIRAVRDLIAVARLNRVVYKAEHIRPNSVAVEYERVEFGTATQPGGLVRSSRGDYFTFESDRHGLLLNWSTNLTAEVCFRALLRSFKGLKPATSDHASVVGLVANGLVRDGEHLYEQESELLSLGLHEDRTIDPTTLIVDMSTTEAQEVIQNQASSLVFVRLGMVGLYMTWHRPYARFVDSDVERAEVGLYTRDYSQLDMVGGFARFTSGSDLFDAIPVTAQIRERGNVKHVRI